MTEAAATATPGGDQQHRLPRSVVPERYEIVLTPDLEAATFEGVEDVRVRVVEPVSEVVLNAAELRIAGARLERDGRSLAGTVTLDDEAERATISLDGEAEPGDWTLHLEFTGILNDKLAGFYRSTWTDAEGTKRPLAASQFEATDARRAFPCWDEPDRKAVFAVTLVVDEGLTAVSNSPVLHEEAVEGGRRRVVFADTMPMSTYLVAFVVGLLEATDPVDVDGVPLRVVSVPGKGGLTDFALEVGAHVLRFFAGYFGIPYPGQKLDLIALPDFASGAMENLGAVTFRETLLLVDRRTASRDELENVALVIAHEISHMWFGDLVTMRWWNGLWLNEAFATFMELVGTDDFHPEWEPWVRFGTSKGAALVVDGLRSTRPIEFPVGRPEEAEGMFDVLTYEKGAGVVRMLEQYLGGDEFRAGIRRYMAEHAYGNTETGDLWDALEAATGEPVRATMDSWIHQGGYPVVSVEAADGGTAVVLRQQRFRYLADDDDGGDAGSGPPARWQVPAVVRASVDGGDEVTRRVLLTDESTRIDLGGRVDRVMANSGGWGFYRTRYSPPLLRRLTEERAGLGPVERFNLVNDAWALALAGVTPAAEFVDVVRPMGDEDDPTVWAMILGPFDLFERTLAPEHHGQLAAFVRRLARPAFDRLGWERAEGENEKTSTLRATLLGALGGVGADEEVRQRAVELHQRYLDDRTAVDPDLLRPVVGIVARTGGPAEYDVFLDRMRHPATPQEEIRYLYALAGFRDRGLVRRTLDLALSDEVRTQNAPFLVNALLGNPTAGDLTWSWIKERWTTLTERFPDNTHARMVEYATTLPPGLAADVRSFLEAHPVKSGHQTVVQVLERLDVNAAFRRREADRLAAIFAAG